MKNKTGENPLYKRGGFWYNNGALLRDASVVQLDRASDSGSECWGFESLRACHVGASVVSLAPTYFISQSALTPLLLLSKSNPLRWASIWGALWAALFTIIKISVLTVICKLKAAFQSWNQGWNAAFSMMKPPWYTTGQWYHGVLLCLSIWSRFHRRKKKILFGASN